MKKSIFIQMIIIAIGAVMFFTIIKSDTVYAAQSNTININATNIQIGDEYRLDAYPDKVFRNISVSIDSTKVIDKAELYIGILSGMSKWYVYNGNYNSATGRYDFVISIDAPGFYVVRGVRVTDKAGNVRGLFEKNLQEVEVIDMHDELSCPSIYANLSRYRFQTGAMEGPSADYFPAVSCGGDGDTRKWPVVYAGYTFKKDDYNNVRCYDSKGNLVINQFKCDGIYTYYFQCDGTAMINRLTYHPDGVHIIYFDDYGHEVFNDFEHVSKSISGEYVDDYCFFNVYGYMYIDVLTYDKAGEELYYANPYGVLERGKWFQYSNHVKWADGVTGDAIWGRYGCAQANGHLVKDQWIYDWMGNLVYIWSSGIMAY